MAAKYLTDSKLFRALLEPIISIDLSVYVMSEAMFLLCFFFLSKLAKRVTCVSSLIVSEQQLFKGRK